MRNSVILVTLVVAISTSAFAAKDSVEQLKARLARANEGQRIDLCLQIARQQLDNADRLYSDGKVEEARAAVGDVVSYIEQAGDTASKSGKKVKKAEIMVREISKKLKDIKRTLNFDDQAPVQDAIDRLEKVRSELLGSMFGKTNQ
jgi:DNA repair ATPase RecN